MDEVKNPALEKQELINPDVQLSPIVEEFEEGQEIYWCTCGYSKNGTICDGSHKITNGELRPIKCKIERAGKNAMCACKRTTNPPLCDGSHGRLL